MNLKEALDRIYEILGEHWDSARASHDHLMDLANRGALIFRSQTGDIWHRTDIQATAPPIPVPAEILEIRRIAYDDGTLDPASSNVLQSRDYQWQTRTGVPEAWTCHGLPTGFFRLWPIPPSTDTPDITWNIDLGITTNVAIAGGGYYTLTADPAAPVGWSADNGLLVTLDSLALLTDEGEIYCATASGTKQITIWGIKKPPTMASDDVELPIRRPWQMAIIWSVLWQLYEEEGDLQNTVLSAYYRDQFWEMVGRCKVRAADTIPSKVRALRDDSTGGPETFGIQFQDLMIGGILQTTDWSGFL